MEGHHEQVRFDLPEWDPVEQLQFRKWQNGDWRSKLQQTRKIGRWKLHGQWFK